MTRNHITSAVAASAALLALSACGSSQSETADAQNNVAAHAVRVTELPPSIQKSRTYRCSDNSIFYVDFLTNNTARIRTEQNGTAATLTAQGGNPPFVAEGYSIAANADQTRIAAPGHAAQSCRSNS
jgi:hypothetical protein